MNFEKRPSTEREKIKKFHYKEEAIWSIRKRI
jgi:hypothetical protein